MNAAGGATDERATGLRPGHAIGVGVLAGLLLGAVGGWVLHAPRETTRPLLDAWLPLESEGAVFAFTLGEPGIVRVRIRLERCTASGEAVVGPWLPARRPHLVYEPDRERDFGFPIQGGATATQTLSLQQAGVHAVRILPIPRAMGGETQPTVHVVVERIPSEWVDLREP